MSGTSLIRLAVDEMGILLGAEPKLAQAFDRLQKRATDPGLKKFCKQGVTYTNRRVRRLKAAFRALGLKAQPEKSAALPGLIADALASARGNSAQVRDTAILAGIEPISHYGLALYTSIDRYLGGAQAKKARKILAPILKEKREAIDEMSDMGSAQVAALEGPSVPKKRTPRGKHR